MPLGKTEMGKLTLPPLSTTGHSTGRFPSSETVVVMWNFAFSFAAALAFFCALSASQTPIVVGIAEMIRSPTTIFVCVREI